MDAAAPLGRGHPLDAVAARFPVEFLDAGSFEGEEEELVACARVRLLARASFSTLARGEAQIGGREVGDEEAGIRAALGGAQFDRACRHGDTS